jgi:hypothetical protein
VHFCPNPSARTSFAVKLAQTTTADKIHLFIIDLDRVPFRESAALLPTSALEILTL